MVDLEMPMGIDCLPEFLNPNDQLWFSQHSIGGDAQQWQGCKVAVIMMHNRDTIFLQCTWEKREGI
jgi:hypothetical protein